MLIPDSRFLSAQDLEEVQGLVIFGTKLPLLRYHFFHVDDPVRARSFLGWFVSNGPLTITHAGHRSESDAAADYRLYLALTALGLRALGEPADTLMTFPKEFRQGARARASELGDTGGSAPERWTLEHDRVHIAVLLYAAKPEDLERHSAEIVAAGRARGCSFLSPLDGAALPDLEHQSGQAIERPVHFNFRDGVSQPALMGVHHRGAAAQPGPEPVPPGMFVLGHHYHPDDPIREPNFSASNEPVPQPRELGYNGTYAAFRMLEQDCDAFEEFLDRNSGGNPQARELLAAKMCGRWRNGRPLTLAPHDPAGPVAPGEALNDFDYRPTPRHPNAIDDSRGAMCPIGSHIRRANPRSADVLGQSGNRIRLIRRGMPYGPPHVRGDGRKRGMLGLFFCASLKHQFEFVQKHWINDGLFARNLPPGERDPLVGSQEPGAAFTYPAGRGTAAPAGLKQFVVTRGAAYLFFPSVPALKFLSANRPRGGPGAVADLEISEQDRIQAVVKNMLVRLGQSPNRDAHPKHHGVVRAVFEVLPDLPPALARGLFAKHDKYEAYVRFSNGSPRVVRGSLQPDSAPDSRGMAIKLLGIAGPKLMDDERMTHDFVLASHPVFFTRDLGDYVRFLDTPTPALGQAFPLLAASFKMHDNPLSTRYFSQTPYALGGDQVVKYVAVPMDPAETAQPFALAEGDPRRNQPHFLKDAMTAHLRAREAVFGFHVQFKPTQANVDDAAELWDAGLHQVARITIPVQVFDTERQNAFAEAMSFSPWHCLEPHRPLGSVNLARKEVYTVASAQRHKNAKVPLREPDGTNDF